VDWPVSRNSNTAASQPAGCATIVAVVAKEAIKIAKTLRFFEQALQQVQLPNS